MRTTEKQMNSYTFAAVLPDGNGGFTPCPEVLTEEEAIRYLRLDVGGPKNPVGTLRYYRFRGKLKGTRYYLNVPHLIARLP